MVFHGSRMVHTRIHPSYPFLPASGIVSLSFLVPFALPSPIHILSLVCQSVSLSLVSVILQVYVLAHPHPKSKTCPRLFLLSLLPSFPASVCYSVDPSLSQVRRFPFFTPCAGSGVPTSPHTTRSPSSLDRNHTPARRQPPYTPSTNRRVTVSVLPLSCWHWIPSLTSFNFASLQSTFLVIVVVCC